MPSESGPPTEQGRVRVAVAPVVEFHFGLYLLTKSCTNPDKWVPPWVEALNEHEPGLVSRFINFWVDRGLNDLPYNTQYYEYGELLVATWRAGLTFATDLDMVLDSLEGALERNYETPALESEPPEIRDLIDKRLALLRANRGDRKEYVEIIRNVWNRMKPSWETTGRPAAERAARALAARVRPDIDLRVLTPGNHFLHKDEYQPQIQNARERGELVVVPLGLSGAGQLFWSLPGVLIVGTGLENEVRDVQRRERAERAAGRLKVLSDPTRLAILFELLRTHHHAATVTELASLFSLSQPTVSVHVKLLREAGLIKADREGNQVHYHAEESTIRAYMDEALEEILREDADRRPSPRRSERALFGATV